MVAPNDLGDVGATLVVAQNDLDCIRKRAATRGNAPTEDQTIYWVAFEIKNTSKLITNIEFGVFYTKESLIINN